MRISDAALIALVQSHGVSVGDLFLVGTNIYASEDAGDFQARSTYAPFPSCAADHEAALVSFLRLLNVPAYQTLAQVDDAISRCKEWEALHIELRDALSRYGAHTEGTLGDFLVVDQDYGYPQVKIECLTPGFFRAEVAADIQIVLSLYQRKWEVVLSSKGSDGSSTGYRIYADAMTSEEG